MTPSESTARPRGVVVAYTLQGGGYASEHEQATRREFARRLAALKGLAFAGEYDAGAHYEGRMYFVPSGTLVAGDEVSRLGIAGKHDLYGGVVPHAFVATKSITHALVDDGAAAPAGWSRDFPARVASAVLVGYTAFSVDDARQAGRRLLARGPARVKPVRATGGRGQSVARDAAELDRRLAAQDAAEIAEHGLVIEEHLADVVTFSVGQVCVDELVASYHGSQRLTTNNHGEEVYGGSTLTVVRGEFDALLAVEADGELRHAIEQARAYDAAVSACFPGFYASRNNYDIVRGRDASGAWRSGVLEQSWRVGGATGAEIAALEILRADPARCVVRASTVEVFGQSPEPPAGATVYFRGTDEHVGPLTKYALVETDVHAR